MLIDVLIDLIGGCLWLVGAFVDLINGKCRTIE